jgi:hypothetical protein
LRFALPLLLAAAVPAAAQGLPVGFGWFGALSGSCWLGHFPDGRTSHRQCYTTQFNRFLRGTASLLVEHGGKPTVGFSGDSVFAWDDSRNVIDYYIWGSDGTHRQLQARYEAGELHFPVPSRSDPSTVTVRSVWKRLDPSSFEVRRERLVGAEWKTELVVTYHRDGTSP